ncbi:MAG: hypothetical protein AAF490_28470 [Chloroflexota bacterium]
MTTLPLHSLPLFLENRLRHRVWWMHPILLFILLQPIRPFAYITIGYLCFLALKDYLSMIPTHRMDRGSVLIAYFTIPLLIYWAATDRYGLYVIWIPLVVFLGICLSLYIRKKRFFFKDTIRPLVWGMIPFLFGLGHLVLIMVTPREVAPPLSQNGNVLYLVVLVQFAIFVSLARDLFLRPFKGPPMFTWTSALGIGLITAVFSAIIVPLFIVLPLSYALVIGASVGTAVFTAQGFVQMLQESVRIPIHWRTVQGHGGILLQIAGYTLSAPIYFHLIRLAFL